MKKVLILLLAICVIACKKAPNKPVENKTDSADLQTVADSISVPEQQRTDKEANLTQINKEILTVLKNKDYKKLARFIHPEKGIRFSMYAFVNAREDKHFSKAEFEKYQPAKTIFTWGALDGSGDVYKATIDQYLERWVYSKDFITGRLTLNGFQGKGNSLNNLKEAYPGADFTENYIKGSEANAEMDWKALRLVFEQFQGKYYLVGVINDQWTI